MLAQTAKGTHYVSISEEQLLRGSLEILVNCMTKAEPVIVHLPSIKSFQGRAHFKLYFYDVDKNCTKNKITIMPSEGDTISGALEVSLDGGDGMGAIIFPLGNSEWKSIPLA